MDIKHYLKKPNNVLLLYVLYAFLENDVFMKNMYDIKEESDSNRSTTLEQARLNYKKYGAYDKEFINKVRRPNKDEIE